MGRELTIRLLRRKHKTVTASPKLLNEVEHKDIMLFINNKHALFHALYLDVTPSVLEDIEINDGHESHVNITTAGIVEKLAELVQISNAAHNSPWVVCLPTPYCQQHLLNQRKNE